MRCEYRPKVTRRRKSKLPTRKGPRVKKKRGYKVESVAFGELFTRFYWSNVKPKINALFLCTCIWDSAARATEGRPRTPVLFKASAAWKLRPKVQFAGSCFWKLFFSSYFRYFVSSRNPEGAGWKFAVKSYRVRECVFVAFD